MFYKNSKFYSFITDIPESTLRTPIFKICHNIHILAFSWINFTFPGSKCIHYVIDNKILHIKGSVFVSEALELRAGIAGIRAFSFHFWVKKMLFISKMKMNFWKILIFARHDLMTIFNQYSKFQNSVINILGDMTS